MQKIMGAIVSRILEQSCLTLCLTEGLRMVVIVSLIVEDLFP